MPSTLRLALFIATRLMHYDKNIAAAALMPFRHFMPITSHDTPHCIYAAIYASMPPLCLR